MSVKVGRIRLGRMSNLDWLSQRTPYDVHARIGAEAQHYGLQEHARGAFYDCSHPPEELS